MSFKRLNEMPAAQMFPKPKSFLLWLNKQILIAQQKQKKKNTFISYNGNKYQICGIPFVHIKLLKKKNK